MKRFVELIMSLIVTAAAYAIMHIIFVTDLFQWKSELPIYVPTGLAVFTGFIFYFIISGNADEKAVTDGGPADENEPERAGIFYFWRLYRAGAGEPDWACVPRVRRSRHVHRGAVKFPVWYSGHPCGKAEKR